MGWCERRWKVWAFGKSSNVQKCGKSRQLVRSDRRVNIQIIAGVEFREGNSKKDLERRFRNKKNIYQGGSQNFEYGMSKDRGSLTFHLIFRSILSYCSTIWSSSFLKLINFWQFWVPWCKRIPGNSWGF